MHNTTMKKRFYLLLLLTSSLLIIYFFDNYLSTRVNNLTTVNYACYLYNNEKCKNDFNTQHHNKVYKDTEQNDITFKEYKFSTSASD
jgi:competence protein ComGF